jgi:hypothetical protein
MAERRVAELAPPFELARHEPLDVVARRERDRARVGLERLHDHAAGSVPAGAAGELREELERPLLRTEVRQPELGVRIDDGCERDAFEVMTLRDHLRAEQHRAVGLGEPA